MPYRSANRRTVSPSSLVSLSSRPAAGSSRSRTEGADGIRCDPHEPAPAVRKLVRPAVEVVHEPELAGAGQRGRRQHRSRRPHQSRSPTGRGVLTGTRVQVLGDRDLFEELERLERSSHTGACPPGRTPRPSRHRRAVEEHPTRGRLREAGQRVDDRRLPGAVRPDQAHHLRGATRKLTPSTATTAPNRTVRSSISRVAGATALGAMSTSSSAVGCAGAAGGACRCPVPR